MHSFLVMGRSVGSENAKSVGTLQRAPILQRSINLDQLAYIFKFCTYFQGIPCLP
jgi:hypothetical protein